MTVLLRSLAVRILVLLSALLLALPAHARRVALVVGNVAYTGEEGRLDNAGNDARAVAALLKDRLGFELVDGKALIDLDRDRLNAAIERLREQGRGAELALFYYAGHGVGGVANVTGVTDTWLQPIGAPLASDADVRHRTVSLSWLADKMTDSGAAARILIIDACRNHPLYRARGPGERGLTRITPPSGTLIAYAAAPGQTSKDQHPDKGAHGLYTGELLDHLATPGLAIKRMFDRVGEGVHHHNPRQLPVMDDVGLYREIVLLPAADERLARAPDNVPHASPALDLHGNSVGKPSGPVGVPEQYPVGKVFRDCPDCPDMVVVPAGRSLKTGGYHVGVRRLAIGRTEVTQGQWRAVMGSNPSRFADCGDDCPVENVSWNDVQEYVRKLSQQTGQAYRLPSGAEWEYACRSGATQEYCGGDSVEGVAWYTGNSSRKTHAVARKQPNGWGLYDMSGNVWEWVQDCVKKEPVKPVKKETLVTGTCGEARVLRGGSWLTEPPSARAAYSHGDLPVNRSDDSGFRLARTLP